MVEGAALEMLCPQKGPRVRIPDSPLVVRSLKVASADGFFILYVLYGRNANYEYVTDVLNNANIKSTIFKKSLEISELKC